VLGAPIRGRGDREVDILQRCHAAGSFASAGGQVGDGPVGSTGRGQRPQVCDRARCR
jgi:hypothetical protein